VSRPAELYVLPGADRAVIYADKETAATLLELFAQGSVIATRAQVVAELANRIKNETGAKTLAGALRVIRRWKPKAGKRR
jgi:hypothetical protein